MKQAFTTGITVQDGAGLAMNMLDEIWVSIKYGIDICQLDMARMGEPGTNVSIGHEVLPEFDARRAKAVRPRLRSTFCQPTIGKGFTVRVRESMSEVDPKGSNDTRIERKGKT